MKNLLLLTPLILLLSCEEGSTGEKIFLCKCMEEPNTDIDPAAKEVFVFLIKGDQEGDCCSASVLEEYPGHYEIWKSETPEMADTWKLAENDLTEIPPKSAQQKGCALQNKEIKKYDVDEFDQIVKDYYPLLPER